MTTQIIEDIINAVGAGESPSRFRARLFTLKEQAEADGARLVELEAKLKNTVPKSLHDSIAQSLAEARDRIGALEKELEQWRNTDGPRLPGAEC